jgi:hypothetical protein
MSLFKYKGRLFSTETIAHVDDLTVPDGKQRIQVNFNSGDAAPITLSGTLDQFLEASRTGPAPEPSIGLGPGFANSARNPVPAP